MDRPVGHSCLLAFDRDSVDFARGFEAGRVWGELRSSPGDTITASVRADSAEMVLRIAEATGRRVTAVELDPEWLEATFEPEESS